MNIHEMCEAVGGKIHELLRKGITRNGASWEEPEYPVTIPEVIKHGQIIVDYLHQLHTVTPLWTDSPDLYHATDILDIWIYEQRTRLAAGTWTLRKFLKRFQHLNLGDIALGFLGATLFWLPEIIVAYSR